MSLLVALPLSVAAALAAVLGLGTWVWLLRSPAFWIAVSLTPIFTRIREPKVPATLKGGICWAAFALTGLVLLGIHASGPTVVVSSVVTSVYQSKSWWTEVNTENGKHFSYNDSLKPSWTTGTKLNAYLKTRLYTDLSRLEPAN